MFNGIIYDQGIIKSIRKNPRYVSGSLVIEISSNIRFNKSDIGESVCCDGVCLTLIRIKKKYSGPRALPPGGQNFENIHIKT